MSRGEASKETLEGAFVGQLALLQPTPVYMRFAKDRIPDVWAQRGAEADEGRWGVNG